MSDDELEVQYVKKKTIHYGSLEEQDHQKEQDAIKAGVAAGRINISHGKLTTKQLTWQS